jgi:hypothetical protein
MVRQCRREVAHREPNWRYGRADPRRSRVLRRGYLSVESWLPDLDSGPLGMIDRQAMGPSAPRADRTGIHARLQPELNPAECLNQDVKSNALGRRRPRDLTQLIREVRAYLKAANANPESSPATSTSNTSDTPNH